MLKIALITGITGQDGSYLSELLLKKEYKIYGIIRRHSVFGTERIEHIIDKLNLRYGDMTDQNSIHNILNEINNKNPIFEVLEIYNLAAQSHVKVSFEIPEYTSQVDGLGTLRILNSISQSPIKDKIRFYQASTSELYGKVLETPQNECTPFNPQSPYAIAKLYSYWIVNHYRDAYNMYACNGILFNHTSQNRGKTFVCKKITDGVKNIINGNQQELILGNLNAKRDIGYAPDFVYGMWLMLQQDKCDNYVLATGKTYSIREIIEMAFKIFDKEIKWSGQNEKEIGMVDDKIVVRVDKKYFRPTEVDLLLGDSTKAKNKLNWEPKHSLYDIIYKMVKN
jgi:GDPmannose 4,6-dehydratase